MSGSAGNYFMQGTMGPENSSSPGKLTLDSSGAILGTDVNGQSILFQLATLNTITDPSDPRGLKSNNTFSVTGVFDLVLPGVVGTAYGIRLDDGAPTNDADDVAFLGVARSASGVIVSLEHVNFVTGTTTFVDQATLDPTHDKIALTLTKADANSDVITGSFAYIDGASMGAAYTFTDTLSIFGDEAFTRAEFEAIVRVPEPATMLFLGSGLLGLVGLKKRLRK